MAVPVPAGPEAASTGSGSSAIGVGPVLGFAAGVVVALGALLPWSAPHPHEVLGLGDLDAGSSKGSLLLLAVVLCGLAALSALIARRGSARRRELCGAAMAICAVTAGVAWAFQIGVVLDWWQGRPVNPDVDDPGALAVGIALVPIGAVVGLIGGFLVIPGRSDPS